MTDPEVRVVVEGLRRWERDLKRLLRQRDVAIHLSDDLRQALAQLDRNLAVLEREMRVGKARP